VFVSFASDSGIRFSAYFYDVKADKTVKHTVSGWVTGDDGVSQATILMPSSGVQLRVGSFNDFLAVIPNGQEAEYQGLLDAKIEDMKKASANAVAEKAAATAEKTGA
jgi:hypothetical protein